MLKNKPSLPLLPDEIEATILSLIRSKLPKDALRLRMEKFHDNDIAAVLPELTTREKRFFADAVGTDAMASILLFADDPADFLDALIPRSAALILEQMEAADVLEALEGWDQEKKDTLLSLIRDRKAREDLLLLSSYEEDRFGSRMSTEFVSVDRSLGVQEIMKRLIARAAETDHIATLFVTDDNGLFRGAIDLKSLIIARRDDHVEDFTYTSFPFVRDTDKISENLERVKTYGEELIPVLDSNDRPVGVLTANDILELVDEEMEDDYAKFAALGTEKSGENLFTAVRKRLPWLVILLFLGLAVSSVVGLFESVVSRLPMIVAFQSLILGMAGNVGTQSLAVTVRKLTNEDKTQTSELFLTVFRETRIAMAEGVFLGVISFGTVILNLLLMRESDTSFLLATALCVAAAILVAMTISGFTGACIPILLYRMKIDPAIASGPLITTVNDLVAVVSYYSLAMLLLLQFAV